MAKRGSSSAVSYRVVNGKVKSVRGTVRYQVTDGGANRDVKTKRVRGSNGKFARVLVGNFRNSAEAKAAKAGKGSKFGTRRQKYGEIRDALGLASG